MIFNIRIVVNVMSDNLYSIRNLKLDISYFYKFKYFTIDNGERIFFSLCATFQNERSIIHICFVS